MKASELRGDYSRAGSDYVVEQDWAGYTPEEHALYRKLFERQSRLVPRYACPEWIEAISGLESQAWITGTDAALFAPLRPAARFLSVSDGTLSETEF